MEAGAGGQGAFGGDSAAAPVPQQAPAPAAPSPGQQQEGGTDFGEQLSDYGRRLDALEQAPQEQEPYYDEEGGDLYDGLAGEPTDEELAEIFGITPEEVAALDQEGGDYYPEEGGYDDENQQALAQFDELVDDRVQEAVAPFFEERQREELNALTQRYPDIESPEVFEPLRNLLHGLVERHDNPDLATDPEMVAQAYKAVKADLAAASENPAERAAGEGASLETGAGPSQKGGEDIDKQFVENLMKTRSGGDVFTGS